MTIAAAKIGRLNDFVKFRARFRPNNDRWAEVPYVRQAARIVLLEYIQDEYSNADIYKAYKHVFADITKTTNEQKQQKKTGEINTTNTFEELIKAWGAGRGSYKLAVATIYFLYRHTDTDVYGNRISFELFRQENNLQNFTGIENGFPAPPIAIDKPKEKSKANGKVPNKREPSAPFEHPPYVSREDAFSKDSHEGIWLNPHNHYSLLLSGRKKEWGLLQKFIGDKRGFLIGAVIAPSGAGKTRLISQWMKPYVAQSDDDGWDAGFIERLDVEPWKEWMPQRNTLIIIDYTCNYDEVLRTIKEKFKDYAPHKIRVLMLDHVLSEKRYDDIALHRGFSKQGNFDGEDSPFFKPFPIVLEPEADQSSLLRDVIACAADPYTEDKRFTRDSEIVVKAANSLMAIGKARDDYPTEEQIRRQNSVRHPLFAALMGQAIYYNDNSDFTDWSRRDLITHYFDSDQRIPWKISEKNKYANTLGHWVGCYVAAATLRRGMLIDELHDCLADNASIVQVELDNIVDLSNRLVASADTLHLKPFEPDILGEAFFVMFLGEIRRNKNVRPVFIKLLCTHANAEAEEKSVKLFMETMQRLVRNLINDDPDLFVVEQAWQSLCNILDPKQFPKNSLMRQAVSIVLVDSAKQLRQSDQIETSQQLIDQISANDLVKASSGSIWNEAAIAFVHYFNWIERSVGEDINKNLLKIIEHYKSRSVNKWSGLMLVSNEGCLRTAKHLHKNLDEDVNGAHLQGWTALMMTAQKGNYEIAEWLFTIGAKADYAKIKKGTTALILASQEGHVEVTRLLLEHEAEVNQATDKGVTALMWACLIGHIAVARLLLEHEAEVNQETMNNGFTALTVASQGGHVEVARLLLEHEAEVNQGTMNDGFTALMWASQEGHVEVTRLLLEHEAEVNQATTDNGLSALMIASQGGHVEVARLLLEHEAEVNQATTDNGLSALLIASQGGRVEVARLLLEHEAEVNQTTTDKGETILSVAVNQNQGDVVRMLLDHPEININQAAFSGLAPIHMASGRGYVDILKMFFLHRDYNINLATKEIGVTPLMLACGFGQHNSAALLLKQTDIEVNLPDQQGHTALDHAITEDQIKIVEMLIIAGGKRGMEDGNT